MNTIRVFLGVVSLLLALPAVAIQEGDYRENGGALTSIKVKKVKEDYEISGRALYGGIWRGFSAKLKPDPVPERKYWTGDGWLEALYHSPQLGTVTCEFEFSIKVYEKDDGKSLELKVWVPTDIPTGIMNRICPSRNRPYNWFWGTSYRLL